MLQKTPDKLLMPQANYLLQVAAGIIPPAEADRIFARDTMRWLLMATQWDRLGHKRPIAYPIVQPSNAWLRLVQHQSGKSSRPQSGPADFRS
jgi:hypothetical protein